MECSVEPELVGAREDIKRTRLAYFKKNLRPNSEAFFFIALHDFTTRASCSSVKPLNSEVLIVARCFRI